MIVKMNLFYGNVDTATRICGPRSSVNLNRKHDVFAVRVEFSFRWRTSEERHWRRSKLLLSVVKDVGREESRLSENTYLSLRSDAKENKNERQRREARSTRYPIWYPTSVESAISCICMPKYTRYTHKFVHAFVRSSLLVSKYVLAIIAIELLNAILHAALQLYFATVSFRFVSF